MRGILALDPAWTVREPSGVAALRETASGWRCAGVAPSYAQFAALAEGSPVDWSTKPTGETPNVDALIAAAKGLIGDSIDLVTIDMPVATIPITRRRAADTDISREFGVWVPKTRPSR